MTELNQRVSTITREVIETGEPVQVTKHGDVVLRIVPELRDAMDPLERLIAAGKAMPPRSRGEGVKWSDLPPVVLSRPLDELVEEERRDADI